MFRIFVATILITSPITLLAAPVPKEKARAQNDKERILGAWEVYSNVKDVGSGTNTIWTFTEGRMHSTSGNTNWIVTLDTEKSPKHFNISQIGGNSNYIGIYEFEGERLLISFTPGNERPAGFMGVRVNVLVKPKS